MNMEINYIGIGKFEVNTNKHKMYTDLFEKSGGEDHTMTLIEIL